MILNHDEPAAARRKVTIEALKGAKHSNYHPGEGAGILVVALMRPPPNPNMPTIVAAFPQKALMNLVTDLCGSR